MERGAEAHPVKSRRLRACFKNPRKRRVRARGLQETRRFWPHCRPGPLTGRFLTHALRTAALGVTTSLLAMARAGGFIIGKGLFRPAKVIHSSGCATGSAAAGLKPGKGTFQAP